MENLHKQGDLIRERYRIVSTLGQGAFGTTYEAEDLINHKCVAIKALSLRQIENWKVLDLFEREARVLANLNHPAIPKYLDHFYEDSPQDRHYYLVQELVGGESLASLVKKGWHGTEQEIREIARQVLEILHYLHQLRPPVIHRDIKPQNIIMSTPVSPFIKGTGGGSKIVLVDFGAVQDVYRHTLTRGGTFVGTLGYMPPEQLRGDAFFASDLYSLGATLIFLLTHRSPSDLPQKRMKFDFRSRVHISPQFADWLEKMVEPMVEDRFKSAREALKYLRNNQGSDDKLPLTRSQPKGSRIVVNKTEQCLRIQIPPAGLKKETLNTFLFAFIWNLFICFWTFIVIAFNAPIIFTFFNLPFWGTGLFLIGMFLFAIAGQGYLEVDRDNFRLGWSCLGFRHQVKGKTAKIKKVELDVCVNSKGKKNINSVIYEGLKRYPFAWGITPVEKAWLVEEVNDFLRKPNEL